MSPKCDVLIRCAKSASKFDVTVRESNHLRQRAPLDSRAPAHPPHAAAITLVIFFLSNEKFDREGKKKFIDTMENLMERYRVFMKRFELSEDFQAKLTVEQLRTQLGQFGITPEQMFEQMNQTLERMKTQLEQSEGQ